MDKITMEMVEEAASHIRSQWPQRPDLAIVCGSGLGPLADSVQQQVRIPYSEIPHFACSTVAGHAGQLVAGSLHARSVCVLQGRVHPYEGFSYLQCTFAVRVVAKLGARLLILTNAAGALRQDFRPGDIMNIVDHINFPGFSGQSPLKGLNPHEFGETFVAMNNAYDKDIREMVYKVAEQQQIPMHKGVYSMIGGPHFETPAECRLLRLLGADAVGMSTVHEAIVARQCHLKVLAFSIISNVCELDTESRLDQSGVHSQVLKACEAAASTLSVVIYALVQQLPEF